MFALLLKDRGFPVHIYLHHMMKVMNVSRSDAAKRLSQFAYRTKLRDSANTPLNNTMTDWVRTLKTPQWAIISSMQLLEKTGRIPKSNQEWAFWAISRIDNKICLDRSVPDDWPEEQAKKWLEMAERYSYWYNRRSEIKQCMESCESPLLASKMLYNILGEEGESCSYADLFFCLDDCKLGREQVASSVRNDIDLNMLQVEHVCMNDASAKVTDLSLKAQLKTLSLLKIIEQSNILIKVDKAKLLSILNANRAAE